MNMQSTSRILLSWLLASCVFSSAAVAFDAVNLVKNGDFKETYENGLPADWSGFSHPNHLDAIGSTLVVLPTEKPVLQISRQQSAAGQYGEQTIDLSKVGNTVYLSLIARARNIQPGDQNWQWPGLSYAWLFSDGTERAIGPGSWLLLKDSSDQWMRVETAMRKPENAIGLRIAFQGIGWTGEAEFEQVTVEPLD
jgi:hypothetical protein